MATDVTTSSPIAIGRGTVYTVTWADNTDHEMVRRFTPKSGQRIAPGEPDPSYPPSWLMIGGRLTRFLAWVRDHGGAPEQLEFSPWTDVADIAARFADVFGFPGRMGFDASGMKGLNADGREYGGNVCIVEADILAGADVVVQPIAIGDGWIGLVARVSPVPRVLAMKAETVAVVTANMLGTSRRRSRVDAIAFLASSARAEYSALVALLSLRKASTGRPELEARAIRMGELLGGDAAIPCRSLFEFAEHGGRNPGRVRAQAAAHGRALARGIPHALSRYQAGGREQYPSMRLPRGDRRHDHVGRFVAAGAPRRTGAHLHPVSLGGLRRLDPVLSLDQG